MDNNNADDVQSLDDEAADAVTDCLRNSVVLRRILEHFTSAELRQLSFVNKLWKGEARSVMRKRAELTAYVKTRGFDRNNPQKEVEAFISYLKQMNPVPYSGINIEVWMRFRGPCPIPALDMENLQGVVLDQPTLKTVSVKFEGSWMNHMTSPGVLLTKKLLQDCSGFLEELELGINYEQESFMEMVVQGCTFPRLQILKLREFNVWLDDAGYENYMKAILSRAPNLKVLQSDRSINVLLRVLEGSSVMPVFRFAIAPFESISENTFSVIKFENMTLEYTGPEFNLERLNRIAPMLLQQSCTTTLRYVWLDAVLCVALMTYGIRFENVKELDMEIDYEHLEHVEPRISRIVKNFDFSRIFPNLRKVSICSDDIVQELSQDHMNAIIGRANAVLREPMPDRAARVKELVLESWDPSSAAAQFYVEMFPNIEKLEITTSGGGQIPFECIWNWCELREFKVGADLLPMTGNLDSIFCGIFPEEVADLRLKDDEYLKRVNIVPVMPAVTCLKNLRTLSLHHEHHRRHPFGDGATFIFSTVTVLLAFARLPALHVSLKISAPEVPPEMTHLKPYMSLTCELHDPAHW